MSKANTKERKEFYAERLRTAGLKITSARLGILQVLGAEHGPFSAEDLQKALLKHLEGRPTDLVTVYRCLAKFEELGMIQRCDFGDGTIRYELSHAGHHHHHIICRVCKRVEPLPLCPVQEPKFKLPKTGFRDITHRLEFFGICADC